MTCFKSSAICAALLIVSAVASAQSYYESVPFDEVPGVKVGTSQNDVAKTGVTVFWFPTPASGGVFISGGGPSSRETPLLDPGRSGTPVDALVLAGGSSYGLEASNGVMECLEQHGVGFDTGFALVPIVLQSDIYDLSYGSSDIRPDKKMGFDACQKALIGSETAKSGNVGAGVGATVGKTHGMARSDKGGIGYAAAKVGDLYVGAVVVVNALGDIYSDGKKIAGLRTEDRKGYADAVEDLIRSDRDNLFSTLGNTTIGAIFTNADFDPAKLKKIAQIATNAYGRCIRPVGTTADGDSIYAFSTGENKVNCSVNTVGQMASDLMEIAISDAINSSRIGEKEFLKAL